jgi:hypothetical protein
MNRYDPCRHYRQRGKMSWRKKAPQVDTEQEHANPRETAYSLAWSGRAALSVGVFGGFDGKVRGS